ncbi:DUF1120 domain-containing protein [Erwinia sp. Eh17-17]|uniref:DUF1120 domain-containing protein n=1 Tax=Erwinia sp. Eh17-17 TaxID=3080330 RepID=UPI0032085B6D
MKTSITAVTLLALSHGALAADSVDVRVVGTIVPAACTPSFPSGAVVDYGTIKASSLNQTSYTVLNEKAVAFAITCEAPTKVSLRAINGRPNTAPDSQDGSYGFAVAPMGISLLGKSFPLGVAGLGLDGSKAIGGYAMALDNSSFKADGVAISPIRQTFTNNPSVWSVSDGTLFPITVNQAPPISWALSGQLTPVAFTALSGQLRVQGFLNKVSEMDVSKPIHLDGLTTLEVNYL